MKINLDGIVVKRERAKALRRRVPDITFEVKWNPDRRTFDIHREGVRTGSFARDKATAVGLARRDAELERKGPSVVVMVEQNGFPQVQWSRWW